MSNDRSRGQVRRRTRPTLDHDEPDTYIDDDDAEVIPVEEGRTRAERRRADRERRHRPQKRRIVVEEVIHDPIDITFVGQDYEIIPPRLDSILNLDEEADATGDPSAPLKMWLWDAFGEDGYNDVMDRIEDPDDKAGWEEVKRLIQAVSEYVGKNRRT